MPVEPYNLEARKLVSAIKALGYTNQQIADALGVKTSGVRSIAKGDTPGYRLLPRLRTMARSMPGVKIPTDTASAAHAPSFTTVRQPAAQTAPTPSAALASQHDEPDPEDADGELVPDLPASARVEAPELPESPVEPRPQGFAAFAENLKNTFTANTAEVSGPTRARGAKSAPAEDAANVVQQLTPLICLVIVAGTTFLLPDPYIDCAPTQDEAEAVFGPVMSIVGRELEVQKRLSETGRDLIVAAIGVGLYGNRAFTTYKGIRKAEADARNASVERERAARRDVATATAGLVANTGADGGFAISRAGGRDQSDSVAHVQAGAARRAQYDGELPAANGRARVDPLEAVLAADAAGRRELGLG